MEAPAGHTRVQLPRENFVTLRFGSADRASVSMRRHCAGLLCADAACFIVQRSGSSGAGHLRCGGIPEPYQAAVVKVRENRGYGASFALLRSGQFSAPCLWVEVLEQRADSLRH